MEEVTIKNSNIQEKDQEFQLNPENLFVLKESNKDNFKLKIKLNILGNEQNFFLDLSQNQSLKSELEESKKQITELKDIIKYKEEKIKSLEEQLNKLNNIIKTQKEKENLILNNNNLTDSDLYNEFNIKLKEPLRILNTHSDFVNCLIILKDGRLASCSHDKSIIIYNKSNYNPDIIIKEHAGAVFQIIQLSTGELISCSYDLTLKIFNIKEKDYELIQTMKNHINYDIKIIELTNKVLASCSYDSNIIFYLKDNNEYKIDYKINIGETCHSIIQTKENEICYTGKNNLYFFDLLERKQKSEINNIRNFTYDEEWLMMATKDLLMVPGDNKLIIVNVNHYKLVREINVPNSGFIYSGCMLNKNMLITGDNNKSLRQWRIDGDNLILISEKDNSHLEKISYLLNSGDGHIISASADIKIW